MNKVIAAMAVALTLTAGQAFAGDGQVSRSGLEAFGLSGLQVVSDADGMAVRGQASFAFVAGGSYSFLPGTGSANEYAAGAAHRYGPSQAEGGSTSQSALSIQFNGNILTINNGSAGGAYASAR